MIVLHIVSDSQNNFAQYASFGYLDGLPSIQHCPSRL